MEALCNFFAISTPTFTKTAVITYMETDQQLESGEVTNGHGRRRRVLWLMSYVAVTAALCLISHTVGARDPSLSPFVIHQTDESGPVNAEVSSPHIIMEHLWATPLIRTHLRTHAKISNLTQFNRRLAAAIAQDHQAFVEQEYRSTTADNTIDLVTLNDHFFEHQVGSGPTAETPNEKGQRIRRMKHRNLEEFHILTTCVAQIAQKILTHFGPEVVDRADKRLQSWVTLHENGSRHNLHVHSDSTLSIVYYVEMPPPSAGGALRLYDPRGPRTPFDGNVELQPGEGEMVVFPGWVAHEVDASSGRRVSVVFNVPGVWEGDSVDGEVQALGQWGGASHKGRPDGWKLDFES